MTPQMEHFLFPFMVQKDAIVYDVPHLFLIHSSVGGHLRFFHVLAIVNGVAINITVHISYGILVSSMIHAQKWDCWVIW